jgi:hypothetical protein
MHASSILLPVAKEKKGRVWQEKIELFMPSFPECDPLSTMAIFRGRDRAEGQFLSVGNSIARRKPTQYGQIMPLTFR